MTLRITVFAIALVALISPLTAHAQEAASWKPAVEEPALAPVIPAPTATPVPPPALRTPATPIVPVTPISFAPTPAGTYATPVGCSDCGGKGCDGCASRACRKTPNCPCPQCRGALLPRSWGTVEYMHLWTKGRYFPALASVSPAGTAANDVGVLPAATVLFGDDDISGGRQSAGRLDFGIWMDPYDNRGVGLRFFGIEGDKTRFSATTNGSTFLAVPYFDVDLGGEDSIVVGFTNLFSGSINHFTTNDLLMGEVYGRLMLARGCGYRLDGFAGYHVVRLDDGISITSSRTVIGTGPPASGLPIGSTIDLADHFKTRNEFHGGETGLTMELSQGCWSVQAMGKLSYGYMRQSVTISGTTVTDVGGGPITANTGLFAQASNIGTHTRDRTTYIPEANITLGYQLTDCVQLTTGYYAAYFPNVLLSGDQIDRNVDLPPQGTAQPAFAFRDTEFWVQGVTFGLRWDF